MKNINQFISDYQRSRQRIYSNHIDYFINKTTFDYKDYVMVMKEMRKKLNAKGLVKIEIILRVQCGQSKRIQNWGELFWQLVDANSTPPELFISNQDFLDSSVFSQQITHPNQGENIENYIVFYPSEDGFNRCLNLVEKEVPYV